jgi:hypothetical protein
MLPALPDDAASFEIDLSRKPELDLKTFAGTHDVRAGVSPDCSFELLKAASTRPTPNRWSTSTTSRRRTLSN